MHLQYYTKPTHLKAVPSHLPGLSQPEEPEPGDVTKNYAEVLADGVGYLVSTLYPYHSCLVAIIPEVPAAALRRYAVEARKEMGESSKALAENNACRDAHRFIQRWGLSWKVDYSQFKFEESGELYEFPYLNPKSWAKFLLEKCPELVMGGITDLKFAKQNLEEFWSCYQKIDPLHDFYQKPHGERKPSNSLAFAFHGDEGRGAKKGNTCVISMETVLGLPSDSQDDSDATHSCKCKVSDKGRKRFKLAHDPAQHNHGDPPLCAEQVTNLKHHSYLTKFVLGVLPHKYYKNTGLLDAFMGELVLAFQELFQHGITVGSEKWFLVVVGCKGDLRWYEKIGNLQRCFNKQIGNALCMCHECGAGSPQMPWEDSSHHPCWGDNLFPERPWSEEPAIARIPCNESIPEAILKRDLFHNTKVGVLRDFCGSAIMMIITFGYFHVPRGEGSNARDSLLERAFFNFRWYCKTNSKYAALHSFTSLFFNCLRSWHYPWINSKGSDTTLLIGWLRVLAVSCLNDIRDEQHRLALETILQAATDVEGWQSIVYKHGLWLTKTCGAVLYEHFHRFIQAYNKLAHLCLYRFRMPGFAMKAKLHMLMHTKFEIYCQLQDPTLVWVLNPNIWNCEMCEDVVGRLSRLSRRCSPQIPAQRTLDLYLIKCKAVYRRYKSIKAVSKRRLKKKQPKKL